MPNKDINLDAVKKVLGDTLGCVERGVILAEVETITDAAQALEKFKEFGGQGWLCTAGSPKVLEFKDVTVQNLDGWPLSGELVKDGESLHLRRRSEGWELATLKKEAGEGVVCESSVLGKGGGELRYQVAYTPVQVQGGQELRPTAFRFIGFHSKEGAGS